MVAARSQADNFDNAGVARWGHGGRVGVVMVGRGRMLAVAMLLAVAATTLQSLPGNAEVGVVTMGGPFGGEIRNIAVSPHDSQHLFASTTQGLFRSTTGGGRWASAGLRNLSVGQVAFDVSTPGVAYAATSGGIFRSDDGGASWAALSDASDLPVPRPGAIQSVAGALYAATRTALFVSRDGGAAWSRVYDAGQGVLTGWAAAPSDSDVIYLGRETAAGDQAMFRSANGGTTWQRSPLGYASRVAVDPNNPKLAYAATHERVAITNDGGVSWTTTAEWQDPLIGPADLALGAGDTVVVAGWARQGGFVSRSGDGGATWSTTRTAGASARVVAADPSDELVIYTGGYGSGISRSVDGGLTFTSRNTGMTAQAARVSAADPRSPSRMFTSLGQGGLFGSADGGSSWSDITQGLVDPANRYARVDVTGVAIAADGRVFASREVEDAGPAPILASADDGATWVSQATGLPRYMTPTHLVAHPTDPDRLLAAFRPHGGSGDAVAATFITKNGGASWSEMTAIRAPVNAVHVDPTSGLLLLATGVPGGDRADRALYASTNFGDTWRTLTFPLDLIQVSSLGVAARQGRIYAGGTGNNVASSDDNGATWHVSDLDGAAGGFNSPTVSVVAVDPVDNTQIFAGTIRNGLWFSRDRGLTWQPATPGVAGQEVYTLMFPARALTTTTLSASTSSTTTASTIVKHRAAFVGMTNRAKSGLTRILPRPHNRLRPSVTGTRRVGEVLRCEVGRWSRATEFRFRWFRNGVFITGARASTYAVVRADRTRQLSCRVGADGPGGRDGVWSLAVPIS